MKFLNHHRALFLIIGLVLLGAVIGVVMQINQAGNTVKAIEEDVDCALREAIAGSPISPGDVNSPLDYFRPRVGASGNMIYLVTSAEIRHIAVQEETAVAVIGIERDQFYSDGSVDHQKDQVELDVVFDGERWVISDIYVPL